ncbi:uncharacterized protein LOC119770220 isoform X1 [Culex quinquefasciatus]|uniref:uncharacterized protein LOC119770220 isoform X1 n=1 Tax=Culex quinquefasciatus TaxID=7176 RepID=UPI0018E2EA8C|nr:uncharacterized protein LOC119770220 isoform X1 [Culex quinquefasciatus]
MMETDTDLLMPAPEESPYFPEKYPGKVCALCALGERSQLGQGEMDGSRSRTVSKRRWRPRCSPRKTTRDSPGAVPVRGTNGQRWWCPPARTIAAAEQQQTTERIERNEPNYQRRVRD